MVFNEMKKMRIVVGLEQLLMNMFIQPSATLERRIIQSHEFRKVVIDRWADWSLKENRLIDSRGLAKLPQQCSIHSKLMTPELTWMLDRITKGPLDLGDGDFAKFPSTLARTGPQYPFSYSHFDHLRKRAGSLKGTEMTRPIEVVPRAVRKQQRLNDLEVYKWRVADDEDKFEEDPLNPKSVSFFPNSY